MAKRTRSLSSCAITIPTRTARGVRAGAPPGRSTKRSSRPASNPLGARKLPGVAVNLGDALELECKARGYETVKDRTDVPIDQAIGLYLREALIGERVTASARDIVDLWKPWFKARASKNRRSPD